MRFGVDRMRRLMTALQSPQLAFESVHVVGTNGKSSTTRMIAAILQRHGLRTGAYLSPHLTSYTERIQVAESDIDPIDFGAAVQRAAGATALVNHTLTADDHVTQFELITAAAFWEMRRQGVQAAVIEAGLGGRYDATNVLGAGVCVLTSVGLEHTRWLGPTVADIAAEKLAVVGPDATLVVGAGLPDEVLALGLAAVDGDSDRLVVAPPTPTPAAPSPGREVRSAAPAPADSQGYPLAAAGGFQRRNFALAQVAAERFLHRVGRTTTAAATRRAAAETLVPGRFEVVCTDPLTVFDAAHNPDAAAVLAESLAAVRGGRPLALVCGVLDDKDAVGMLRVLLGDCARAFFTAPPSTRALSPSALLSLAAQLGFDDAVCEPQPVRALLAASAWARENGGMVLACGSVYLVGELLDAVGDGAAIAAPPAGEQELPSETTDMQGGSHSR
jgi:dihydrofolate synthase/folylpolyglutamate synthase